MQRRRVPRRPPASAVWKPLSGTPVPMCRRSYRTTLTLSRPAVTGPHPILRALPQGLSRGFVWLNGRDLGRYPEKSPVDGLSCGIQFAARP